jgi:hypothetical protein
MEAFKKKLFRHHIALTVGLFVACGTYFLSRHLVGETQFPENLNDFILGFQTVLFTFLVCTMVFFLVRNFVTLKNPDQIRKLYIIETDERTALIRQKVGSTGMNIIVYGLIIGAVVSGSINHIVFLTLLGSCFFVGIVRGSLKLYYRNKF